MLNELRKLQEEMELLAGLSPDAMLALAAELEEVQCSQGEVLIHPGEPGDKIYVVLSGKLLRTLKEGDHEGTSVEIGPGSVLGGVALMAGGKHMAELRALESCRLAAISRDALRGLRESAPETWQQVSELVLDYMRRQELALHLHRLLGPLGRIGGELLERFRAEISWRSLDSGETLFHQGDPADSIYVVMNGRLQVVLTTPEGDERVLNQVSRGETLGEMAVITDDPRSATVYAVRDTDLARLSLKGFKMLVESRPQAMLNISRLIVERLRRHESKAASRKLRPKCIAVVSASPGAPLEPVARELARTLETHGSAKPLDSADVNSTLGMPDIAQASTDDPSYLRLMPWLQRLEEQFDFLLYQADAAWSPWSERCVNQADVVLIVADASGALPEGSRLVDHLHETVRSGKRVALVLLHPEGTEHPKGTSRWLDALPVKEHYHLRTGKTEDVERLTRAAIGEAVGLVFGGGVARGFAHIGVYKALCEAGIPVDFVGGSSIGSAFAAPIALNWNPDQLARLARESFVDKSILNDYTIPVIAMLKGNKLEKMAKHHFHHDIEDLWRPFFAITSNLSLGELIVNDRGPAWKAIRSSVALPGILPPAVDGNSLLIDGGILNNLPIDIMRNRPGVGRVIAVDLYTPKEYELPYTKVPSAWEILRSRYLPWVKKIRVPGIVTLMMKATEIASIVHAKAVRPQADLWLNPPVYKFGILAVEKFDRIVEVGYEHAKERLAEWQTLSEED